MPAAFTTSQNNKRGGGGDRIRSQREIRYFQLHIFKRKQLCAKTNFSGGKQRRSLGVVCISAKQQVENYRFAASSLNVLFTPTPR